MPTRPCAFCPPPPVADEATRDPAADALWASRKAQIVAHLDAPRSVRSSADLLISQHISRALRTGEEFAPWTPEGTLRFLLRHDEAA